MAEEPRNNDAGINLPELRQTLANQFSESDLRDLAFDLGIEYESLPGSAKGDKARELIAYCRRYDRISELLNIAHDIRPDINFPVSASKSIPAAGLALPINQARPVHQLRSPVADFVGRTAEIEELVNHLSAASTGITGATAIIRGLGGLGKTQLANTVAHRLRENFPDGQVFLELQGVNEGALPPEQVLQRVIQIFEPQVQVPEALGDLQTLYRSILDGKRVLIVADNAKDATQVRSLEPLIGCALLITSRQHFSLPGAATSNLAVLPQDEAEEFLIKLCPRVKSHAPRLAELCGRLPLALRVSASLLANDLTRNIAYYLKVLEEERLRYLSDPEFPDDPTASVSASLDLSYKALNDVRQRILRQISVFPTSFDSDAAKAVISLDGIRAGAGDERELQAAREAAGIVDTPAAPVKPKGRAVVPRVEDSLGILYRRSLIEYDTATQRYNLHDLVRAFAAERLKTTDERLRYAKHYLRVAQLSNTLYSSREYDEVLKGLDIFDNERAHIDTIWSWMRKQPNSTANDNLIIEFAEFVTDVGSIRYNARKERIPILNASISASKRLKRRIYEGNFLRRLGNTYLELGESMRAIELFQQSLSISKILGDIISETIILGSLARGYNALGDMPKAIEYCNQGITNEQKYSGVNDAGKCNNELGLAYIDLGHTQKAANLFEELLNEADRKGLVRSKGAYLGNLGRAYTDLGRVVDAIDLCKQSLSIERQLGHQWQESYALNFLGLAYYAAGEIQLARESQEQALSIIHNVEARRLESQILKALSEIDLHDNDLIGAMRYSEQSLSIAQQIEDRQAIALASWNIGLVHERRNDLAQAIELMQVRIDYEREIGHLKVEEHAAQLEAVKQRLASAS